MWVTILFFYSNNIIVIKIQYNIHIGQCYQAQIFMEKYVQGFKDDLVFFVVAIPFQTER